MHRLRPRNWIGILLSLLPDRRDDRRGRGPSARLGDDPNRTVICARRRGDGRAPYLDLRRHVLSFRHDRLPAKIKGQFTRQELQPLAKVNVESLKDFAFFTYTRINGKRKKDAFNDPVDYWLDYDAKNKQLTLHFTLPFKNPVAVNSSSSNLRSGIFRRFRPSLEDPVDLSVHRRNAPSRPKSHRTRISRRRRV